MHKHWQNCHFKDLPFHFYVDRTVECYWCGLSGFFETIQQHTRKEHELFLVIIKNQREPPECALCWHRDSDGNIADHFRRVHSDEIDSMDTFNPIPFSYRDLMDLNAIGKHDFRCLYCNRSYATEIDFELHQRAKHPGKQRKYCEIKSICCFCGKDVKNGEFLVHVIKKCGIFKCNKCPNFRIKTPETFLFHIKETHSSELSNEFYRKLRRSLMDKFLSMRCIFDNGLVVTKRNLVNLRFGDRAEFMNLIAESVNELKKLAKHLGLHEK